MASGEEDRRDGWAARVLRATARACGRRPAPVLASVAVLAAGGAVLATGLDTSTGTDTLVPRGAAVSQATDAYHRDFGEDPIVVLVGERLTDLLLTSDLGRLLQLEGCLGGNVPRGLQPYGGPRGPCAAIARQHAVRVVYGPATFLNEAVNQIDAELSARLSGAARTVRDAAAAGREEARRAGLDAAGQAAAAAAAARRAQTIVATRLATLATSTGLSGIPRLDDPSFVAQVVFDPARGANVPKARFAYLFPSPNAALVQVRLRPGLGEAARRRAIGLVKAAVAMPQFRLRRGGTYTVTGAPVLADGLARSLTGALGSLLVAALVVMAAVLALVFRARLRLLPLALALAAAALVFGAMALTGAPLTMASVAVLPVLIGLAVDYALQFHARVREAEGEGTPRREAVVAAAGAGGPAIAAACLATMAGFAVLLLSPVPMVRSFGVVLVAGVALAFACAFTAGAAALALAPARGAAARAGGWARHGAQAADAAVRGAGALLAEAPGAGPLARAARGALTAAVRRPGRTLVVAAVLAAAGWALDGATEVNSDIVRLVPQDPALRDVQALQRATGSAGTVSVVVRAADVTSPAIIRWMSAYERGVLARWGYREDRGCAAASLCPALSLPDLFRRPGTTASAARIRSLLAAIPPYFTSAVLTPDHRAAAMTFGLRLQPLDAQQRIVSDLRSRLRPPAGARAEVAGLQAVAIEANDRIASPGRRLLTLAASLLAVALALLLALRRPRRALVPLLPIVLATGWSALVLWLTRLPLNPMSAVLGALVVAISTEFSVLLSERHRAERRAGYDHPAALRRTYRSTGAAVLASGATVLAGFGVLAVSDIRMLRDFGLVTVIDLGVSLLGVLVVLPAAITLAERRAPGRLAPALSGEGGDSAPAG